MNAWYQSIYYENPGGGGEVVALLFLIVTERWTMGGVTCHMYMCKPGQHELILAIDINSGFNEPTCE